MLLGAGIGYMHVRVGELSLAAISVSIVCMALGTAKPHRPWRWALLVALCVPAAMLIWARYHPARGEVYGSFILLAPALVCAFGGSQMRKLIAELFPDKNIHHKGHKGNTKEEEQ